MGTVNGGTSNMPTMLPTDVKVGVQEDDKSKELEEAKKAIEELKNKVWTHMNSTLHKFYLET